MKLFICICLILISNISFSQFRLDIEITSLKSDTGNVMLELLDEKENIVAQEMSPIKNKTCLIVINDLKPGKYGIHYYHDENLNGKMETNIFGKPTEGYGFSNNVTAEFGPPPFKKWLFEINGDKKIQLKPTY